MSQSSTSPSYAQAVRESGQDMPFDTEELIYSRTNERGLIQSANTVFQRLSGFEWRELIGAPHKIVRHPDMPKGFFHIFWQYLKAGEPAVGYVKNRSQDGRYYWVLAAAIPCDGGYFSVRMKPSSPLFHQIRNEYARVRRREEAENLSSEKAAELLLERLHDMGFQSYAEFMSTALQNETNARNQALNRQPDKTATHLSELVGALTKALEEQARLVKLFDSLKLLPVNMRLIAARLEPQGGPISQISMNYKTSFDNISERLTNFVTGEKNICGQMDAAVRRALVLANCARLHLEMSEHIRRPPPSFEGEEQRREHLIVQELGVQSETQVEASLDEAGKMAAQLIASAFEIRRLVLGLDTIRILGRVESRRDDTFEAACSATLDQIDTTQSEITESLQNLSSLAVVIQTSLSMITTSRRDSASAETGREKGGGKSGVAASGAKVGSSAGTQAATGASAAKATDQAGAGKRDDHGGPGAAGRASGSAGQGAVEYAAQ
ncbi:PAS domain-containing protein [Rhodobacter sp. NTK016B]|uniref:PAS domain-containing protein n=1 Tax=Rhodobacter sp. NTK016B TaxID=2759676 RepID=UPI001A8D3712|nr:PAS domain-containing protein [Rhodobacter sp. NTK016B]MBN8294271.1 PAS domain-containing protein [Rhodobacter sp. NTK016B]